MRNSFTPGQIWNDTDGVPIQAHGGGILLVDGVYYWFGENKSGVTKPSETVGFNMDAIGVSCYSSTDLYNWENKGLVLPAIQEPAEHELHTSKILERPKVIYNQNTRQYVLFLHVDRRDYGYARVGIAVSDQVTGPYVFQGTIMPHHSDSRDMTVFKDEDGQAYLLHSSEWNATLYIGRLSIDYLHTTDAFTRNFEKGYREAPAVFKHKRKYYLISSGCTGWDPNPAQLAVAENMLGPWQVQGNPCKGPNAEQTFFAQSTFVLPVAGKTDAFIAMFDIWKKEDLASSRYVWLPVQFDGERVIIEWMDEWDLSFFS